ncbi:MAG: hypothetical protein ACLGJB_25945 [Blastocatellia bacterium]
MKITILALVLCALGSCGMTPPPPADQPQPAPDRPTDDVLRAHNVQPGAALLSACTIEALRLPSFPADPNSDVPNFFERRQVVSIQGDAFISHTVAPLGARTQIYVFDGRAGYRAVAEGGSPVEVAAIEGSELRAVEFGVKTFGVVPILNLLSDPKTESVYLGRTARKQDKFQVRTHGGTWTLYANQQHLISRLEAGDQIIEYADYRTTDEGLSLPFIQRAYRGGKLLYELVFTRVELNRAFAPGYFSRETLTREVRR